MDATTRAHHPGQYSPFSIAFLPPSDMMLDPIYQKEGSTCKSTPCFSAPRHVKPPPGTVIWRDLSRVVHFVSSR